MKLFFLTLVGLVLLKVGLAQQAYKEGYILKPDNNYVYGYVGERVAGSPEGISFKENQNGGAIVFLSNEILGYGFLDGAHFLSFQNSTLDMDWVFLEMLVDGELSLISRNDMYFLKRRGSNEFIYLSSIGNEYQKALSSAMDNCPAMQSRARKVKMYKTDLIQIVGGYNECITGVEVSYEGLPPQVSLALLAGLDYSPASFSTYSSSSMRFLTLKKLNDLSWFQAGMNLSLRNNKMSKRLGLYTGIHYNSNKYHQVNKYNTGAASAEVNDFIIEYTELKVPFGIEYLPPTKSKFNIGIKGGLVFVNVLNVNSRRMQEVETNGSIYMDEGVPISSVKKRPQFSLSLFADYRVFREKRIRTEFVWSAGKGTSSIKSSPLPGTAPVESSASGGFKSFSILTGFVF